MAEIEEGIRYAESGRHGSWRSRERETAYAKVLEMGNREAENERVVTQFLRDTG